MTVFNRFGTLIAVVGGGISLVMFGLSGIQYMTAQGDPQAMGRAKAAFIGALVGSAIVGLAFIIPGIISRVIIEPSGGAALQVETGDNCDRLLKNQLRFQRSASTMLRMQEVIRAIQNQRDNCSQAVWNPVVDDTSVHHTTLPSCWAATSPPQGTFGKVGNMLVPSGLRDSDDRPRDTSGRDSSNNIIVYFSRDASQRPQDSAMCWLYVKRLNAWDENYPYRVP